MFKVLFCAFTLSVVAALGTPAVTAELYGTYRFGPIPTDQYVRVAAIEPVIVRLADGEVIDLLGRQATAAGPTTMMSGISADFLYMAVITGRLTSDVMEAVPGQVAYWRPQAGAQVAIFDAGTLAETLRKSIAADLQQALQAVADEQARDIWWGLLVPVGVNLQASTPTGVEIERRSYLSHPTVMELRFNAKSVEQLSDDVADTFVRAIDSEEPDTVAALLHPSAFIEEADYGVSPAALARRQAFAEALVAGTSLDEGAEPRRDDSGTWSVGDEISFTLRPGDGFLFVEPASLP